MVRVLEPPEEFAQEDDVQLDSKDKNAFQRLRQQSIALATATLQTLHKVSMWLLSIAVYKAGPSGRQSFKAVPGIREARRWMVMCLLAIVMILAWFRFDRSGLRPRHESTIDVLGQKHHAAMLRDSTELRVAAVKSNLGSGPPTRAVGRRETVLRAELGTDVIWAPPPDRDAPRGIVFFAHGCGHGAGDFWHDATPDCDGCISLPEEVAITRTVLRLGWVMLTVSSMEACWTASLDPANSLSQDTSNVLRAIEHVRAALHLPMLPVVAMGASSGGAFALSFPLHAKIQGVVSEIMGIDPSVFRTPYPPTAFVHMPRDERTASMVADDIETLQRLGVATKEVHVDPAPLTAAYLTQAIDGVPASLSAMVHAQMNAAGLLTPAGLLATNPRASDWRELLRENQDIAGALSQVPDTLAADKSAIAEELNVLWAGHEIVAWPVADCLLWLAATADSS